MKSIRFILSLLLPGLVYFNSHAQSRSVDDFAGNPVYITPSASDGIDSIAGLLGGRWYATLISGGLGGGILPIIPEAGDSVIVTRINGTEFMDWVVYQNCDTLRSDSYEIVFDSMLTRPGESWMLVSEVQPTLIIEYATPNSLSLAMDVSDGYRVLLERIDTFTLHKAPAITGTTDGSSCGPGEVTLGAMADPGIIKWYADTTGDEVIAFGDTFITPSLDTTSVFYVESFEAGCTTERIAVTAHVYNPVILTVVDGVRCGTGEVTLSASASLGTVIWYQDSEGGTGISAGTTYVTPTLTETTVYYAEATYNNCVSAERMPVTAVISEHDSCLVNTSVAELSGKLRIYPNPSSGKFELLAEKSLDGNSYAEVYNDQGSLILKKSFGGGCRTFLFDLTDQQVGIYFVKLKTSKGVYSFKVVKSGTK